MIHELKIYVDMDGVLSDFEKRFEQLTYTIPSYSRDNKFGIGWRKMVDGGHFADLDLYPGALELVDYLKTIKNAEIALLTSSGGFADHNIVLKQKLAWLKNNQIDFAAIVVPGKGLKRGFARPTSILIDDTPENVNEFKEAGGIGILHTSAKQTIKELEELGVCLTKK